MTANDFYEKFKKGAHHALKKSFKVLVLTAYVNLSFTPTFAMLSSDEAEKLKNSHSNVFIGSNLTTPLNPLASNTRSSQPQPTPQKPQSVQKDLTDSLKTFQTSSQINLLKQEECLLQAQKDYEKGYEYFHNSDYEKALEWFEKAANQGDSQAQYNLGFMYIVGYGTTKDYQKSAYYYKKAASQGEAKAQYGLGALYEMGSGVLQDYQRAIGWYEKAANQGLEKAQRHLGSMYEEGKCIEKNLTLALKWYGKAALNGCRTSQKALKMTFKSIENQADLGDRRAQNDLGIIYFEGKIVEIDVLKAFDYFKQSADQEYAEAQKNLGLMYSLGLGVTQDYQKGIEWYEKAANQGLEKIQHVLGVIYQEGKGVPRNYKKAFEWYERAANQGFQESQYRLGLMYENGQGQEKDHVTAFKFYKKAAGRGHGESQKRCNELLKNQAQYRVKVKKLPKTAQGQEEGFLLKLSKNTSDPRKPDILVKEFFSLQNTLLNPPYYLRQDLQNKCFYWDIFGSFRVSIFETGEVTLSSLVTPVLKAESQSYYVSAPGQVSVQNTDIAGLYLKLKDKCTFYHGNTIKNLLFKGSSVVENQSILSIEKADVDQCEVINKNQLLTLEFSTSNIVQNGTDAKFFNTKSLQAKSFINKGKGIFNNSALDLQEELLNEGQVLIKDCHLSPFKIINNKQLQLYGPCLGKPPIFLVEL